jgi:hypothetical protein
MLQKFAPTAAKGLAPFNAASNAISIYQIERRLGIMPASVYSIARSGLSPQAQQNEQNEANLAQRVATANNRDVVRVDNPSNQAFDAIQLNPSWTQAIPTEFKTLTSSNPWRVVDETRDTISAASGVTLPNGTALTGIEIYMSAENLDANAVVGAMMKAGLPSQLGGAVSQVVVYAQNGTVTASQGKVKVGAIRRGQMANVSSPFRYTDSSHRAAGSCVGSWGCTPEAAKSSSEADHESDF